MVFSLMATGALFSYIETFIFLYLYIRYAVFKSHASIEIQDVLKFHILIEIVNGLALCFSLTHNCIVYNIEDPVIYVTQLLFWDAAMRNITVILRPIAVSILGLDRLLIILFPTTAEYKRKLFSFFTGISLMVICTVVFSIYNIIPNIPTEVFTTDCIVFNCLAKLGNSLLYFIMKTAFGLIDFILGIILLIVLCKRFQIKNLMKNKNKNIIVVISTILLTVTFNFLPNLAGLMFSLVSRQINIFIS